MHFIFVNDDTGGSYKPYLTGSIGQFRVKQQTSNSLFSISGTGFTKYPNYIDEKNRAEYYPGIKDYPSNNNFSKYLPRSSNNQIAIGIHELL
jgi:hypothetical protein